jgi:NAD-dependent deacetylase
MGKNIRDFHEIVVFCGAGLSAESGIPTYRGKGGMWEKYDWQDYACQSAFLTDPEKVWVFHEQRRLAVAACAPNAGHKVLSEMEKERPNVTVVTQNIDGLQHRAGSKAVLELHGSLWRVRCEPEKKLIEAADLVMASLKCDCGAWLRPDIVWFGDSMKEAVFTAASRAIESCDLFIGVGTSGVVYPAAALPSLALKNGATMIEINLEETPASALYEYTMRGPASQMLKDLWEAEDILGLVSETP